ncbi:MAG: hypothetical protein J6333_07625 [Planctomycetes bacterium]|nr:hypothetical protein [Planctomycetota bacterium]
MLKNPVLAREFMTSLRTIRAVGLGLVFLWGLGSLVIFLWPSGGGSSLAAETSRTLFAILSLAFLSLVILCAPSFTATAISHEKENETWETLWDTMLRPGEIIFGKLASGVGFSLILVVCSLPMLGICSIGVSARDVLLAYAIAVVAAFFYGMLGLYLSAVCRNSYRALIACYLAVVTLAGLVWVPSFLLSVWANSFHAIHCLRACSPFAAMLAVVYPSQFAGEHTTAVEGFGAFADSPWVFLIFGSVGALALLVLTWRAVARPPQKRHKDEQLLDDDKLRKRKLGFPFYIFDPRKRKRMIGPIFNVVAVKEMRTKAFGRLTWFARCLSACFIASFVLAFLPLSQTGENAGPEFQTNIALACIGIPLAIIVLICPVLTAGAISDEKQSGIFDMLRVTRISAFTLVVGKLEVAWLFTSMLLISALPTYFVLVYLSSDPEDMTHIANGVNQIATADFSGGWHEITQAKLSFLWRMVRAFGVMAAAMFFATNAGVLASIYCRRTSTATAFAYGAAIFISVVTMLPQVIHAHLPEWFVQGMATLNPFIAAAKAVSKDAFGALPENLWSQNIVITVGISLLMLVVSVLTVRRMMRPTR